MTDSAILRAHAGLFHAPKSTVETWASNVDAEKQYTLAARLLGKTVLEDPTMEAGTVSLPFRIRDLENIAHSGGLTRVKGESHSEYFHEPKRSAPLRRHSRKARLLLSAFFLVNALSLPVPHRTPSSLSPGVHFSVGTLPLLPVEGTLSVSLQGHRSAPTSP